MGLPTCLFNSFTAKNGDCSLWPLRVAYDEDDILRIPKWYDIWRLENRFKKLEILKVLMKKVKIVFDMYFILFCYICHICSFYFKMVGRIKRIIGALENGKNHWKLGTERVNKDKWLIMSNLNFNKEKCCFKGIDWHLKMEVLY